MSLTAPEVHGTPESYLGGCHCQRCLNAELTVPELTRRLRCSEWTTRRLIDAPGGVRGAKVGRRWLVRAEDIEAYLDKKANRRRRRRRAS